MVGSLKYPGVLFTRIRLSVTGQASKPVFVNAIRARIKHQSPPLSGAYLFHGSQGGGELIEMGFDLDEPNSVARVRRDDLTLGEPYVQGNKLTIEPGEPVVISVQGQTQRSYYEWFIEMELDGYKQPLVVDDGGKPFRSTCLAKRYDSRYYSSLYGEGWVPFGAGAPESRLE
jgi:hypothetical protein